MAAIGDETEKCHASSELASHVTLLTLPVRNRESDHYGRQDVARSDSEAFCPNLSASWANCV